VKSEKLKVKSEKLKVKSEKFELRFHFQGVRLKHDHRGITIERRKIVTNRN